MDTKTRFAEEMINVMMETEKKLQINQKVNGKVQISHTCQENFSPKYVMIFMTNH